MSDLRIVAVQLNSAIDRIVEVPRLQVGGHVPGRLLSVHPAGKAMNVSRSLAVCGESGTVTGLVGEADRPSFEHFAAEVGNGRICSDWVPIAGRTRMNVTLVDPVAHQETHIREEGPEVEKASVERLRDRLGALAGPRTIVCFCGSLPRGITAGELASLVDATRSTGASVGLDVSGPAARAALDVGGLWLIKPNREELAELTGRPAEDEADLRRAAESLRGKVEHVLVTAGPDGAFLLGDEGAWRGRPAVDPADVVNTVGSGDSLLGGFLAEWARTGDPRSSLRTGLAAGTANAQVTPPAGFTGEAVDALAGSTSVDRWTA